LVTRQANPAFYIVTSRVIAPKVAIMATGHCA
jgi:hypothetical protein